MYFETQERLLRRVREVIRTTYDIEVGDFAIEQPLGRCNSQSPKVT